MHQDFFEEGGPAPIQASFVPGRHVILPSIWRAPIPARPAMTQDFDGLESDAWERDLVPPPEPKQETWHDRPAML